MSKNTTSRAKNDYDIFFNSMLGIWMHSDPCRQRHGAAPAAVARFGAGVGLGKWEIHGKSVGIS